jgi:purine-binding chemotaxis protein CheW
MMMHSQVTAAAENAIEMCSVRVGKTLYGVPIMRILEILGKPVTQPVPLAPSYIGGLVHYRGEVLTTVSLRKLLSMPAVGAPEDILVFEGSDGYFGLLVDEVGEVMTVLPEDFEGNPSTLDDRRKALFAGTYKLKDALLVMLDPERLDPMRLAETASA